MQAFPFRKALFIGHNLHEMTVASFYSYSAQTVSSKQRKVSVLMFKNIFAWASSEMWSFFSMLHSMKGNGESLRCVANEKKWSDFSCLCLRVTLLWQKVLQLNFFCVWGRRTDIFMLNVRGLWKQKTKWMFLNPLCTKEVQGFTEIRWHLVLPVKQIAAYLMLQWIKSMNTIKNVRKLNR